MGGGFFDGCNGTPPGAGSMTPDILSQMHDAALTHHKDGGAELARLVIEYVAGLEGQSYAGNGKSHLPTKAPTDRESVEGLVGLLMASSDNSENELLLRMAASTLTNLLAHIYLVEAENEVMRRNPWLET